MGYGVLIAVLVVGFATFAVAKAIQALVPASWLAKKPWSCGLCLSHHVAWCWMIFYVVAAPTVQAEPDYTTFFVIIYGAMAVSLTLYKLHDFLESRSI